MGGVLEVRVNFEDFASGRVLYSGKGIPNFPVRLLNEMYGRALNYFTPAFAG